MEKEFPELASVMEVNEEAFCRIFSMMIALTRLGVQVILQLKKLRQLHAKGKLNSPDQDSDDDDSSLGISCPSVTASVVSQLQKYRQLWAEMK